MPRAKRNTPFQPGHGLFYGLRPVSRDPETNLVTSVACRFCEKFGREEKVGAKRRATQHVKHFKQPFRTENYHQHHLGQHPARWSEYQVLSPDRKMTYLLLDQPTQPRNGTFMQTNAAVNPPVSQAQPYPPLSRFSSARSDASTSVSSPVVALKYMVERSVIDKIVADMHLDSAVEPISKEQVISGFATVHDAMNDYIVTIDDPKNFNLVVDQVAAGTIPQLLAKEMGEEGPGISSRNQAPTVSSEFSFSKVSGYLRSVYAINLQSLADIMHAAWAYSLSFHKITCHSSSYIDLRMRFFTCNALRSFHLLVIPLDGQASWENLYAKLVQMLDAMYGKWREKIIGLSINSPDLDNSATGYFIDRLTLEASGAVFHTWSAASHLNAIMESIYFSVLDTSFFETLTQLVAYFRRQEGVADVENRHCPKFDLKRWESVEKALKWVKLHRIAIVRHLGKKKPMLSPPASWWITAMAVLEFIQAVAKTYRRVCGLTATISRQSLELAELVKTLRRLSECRGPVTDNELNLLGEWNLITYEKFIVQKSSIRNFLNGLSTFAHMSMNALPLPASNELVSKVGKIFLVAVTRTSKVLVELQTPNRSPLEIPPVLPHELVRLSRASFNEQVRSQAGRLSSVMTAAEMERIEDEFGELLEAFHRDEIFQDLLEQSVQPPTFDAAWGNMKSKFQRLHAFCGGLATVFPEEGMPKVVTFRGPSDLESIADSGRDLVEARLHCEAHKSLAAWSVNL